MDGFIVITAEAGRALRNERVAPRLADVLDHSGRFHAGNRVYVVVRGHDGGQSVVATGVVDCDAAAFEADASPPAGSVATTVVVRASGLQLLWPSSV